MKGIIALPFAAAVIVAAILVTSVVLLTGEDGVIQKEPPQLKKFASYQELADYIKASDQAGSGFGGYFGSNARGAIEPQAAGAAEDSGQQKSEDYSATNIQVAGVDEADIVKNDGKYIYTVSGNKVIIVDAYPAENAKILSEIDTGGPVQEIFVSGDRLVVFGHQQITYPSYKPNEGAADESGVSIPSRLIPYYYQPKMFLQVYDVSDRENPAISRNMTINGTYFDSRMIGDYAYVIVNMPVSLFGNGDIAIPLLQESGSVTPSKAFPDIYYFDNPDFSYRFTTILSLNTQSDSQGPESQIYLMGDAQNIFVSQQNIYITYSKNLPFYEVTDRLIDEVVLPLVPELGPKIQEIRGMDIPAYEKSQRIYEAVGKHMEGLSQEELRSLQDGAQARLE
ncbi:MAG: beta-propeller domain-containing protein, partial [Candidatus Aenigmarchaeota archaeon]|nr:beta-propeller domain-containing protein [Candidatus Aenigmarchaeota archaeon]